MGRIRGHHRRRSLGGPGADIFIFDIGDSLPGTGAGAGADVIEDFRRRADKIDLSDMSEDGWQWRGKRGFQADGDAEVCYSINKGDAIVKFDRDGDGVVDGVIILTDIGALGAGDFLF